MQDERTDAEKVKQTYSLIQSRSSLPYQPITIYAYILFVFP